MELDARDALDTEEPDAEDDASAAAGLGDDADADDDAAPREEPLDLADGFVHAKSPPRRLPEPVRHVRGAVQA